MRHHDAALALNRFDHNGDGLIVDGPLDRGDVVEVDQLEAGHQRLKSLMIFLLAGGAERAERAAVERSQRRDDLEAPAVAMTPSARELDRRFVRFGAGIAEEHAPVAKQTAQSRGQPRHRFGMEHVGDVRQLFGLLRIARTTRGWPWPRLVTASPQKKSR